MEVWKLGGGGVEFLNNISWMPVYQWKNINKCSATYYIVIFHHATKIPITMQT